ncbi:DUF418 domain-containing protein [Paenibacillus sambharensis]|uniref:DUF418 domain-containing protein n=1 Tax=Paenibacillus sambharensis TaxID=1803190 RepID=A0A2W1LV43_9BACL|nr:DUF418 domain-containing protein [Paenibacillus sambharensis]PZD95377.1 DUF418 domain-containing protein [Paenibacillus sambharensis]
MTQASNERIQLLDILRGFAIMGTLGTNIWLFAHLGDVDYLFTYAHNDWWASMDVLIRYLVLFLVNGKLLGLLTILFGAGLELQYSRSLVRKKRWPGPYLLTALFLMLEGLLHYTLVLEYDILMSYAMTAVLVAWVVKRGERAMKRTMWITGIFHGMLILLLFASSLGLYLSGESMPMNHALGTEALYGSGTWLEQVAFRLANFGFFRTEAIFVLPLNIFLFLTGVRLMRAGAFQPDERGRAIRRRMLKLGLGAGIPLNLLLFVPGGVFDFPLRYLFAPIMAIGYIALLALLTERFSRWSLWSMLERVGRMALSCYVLQNVLASVIFYGWGLGLGGKTSSLTTTAVWVLICLSLLFFSGIWLRLFKQGPLEAARKTMTRRFSARERNHASKTISG